MYLGHSVYFLLWDKKTNILFLLALSTVTYLLDPEHDGNKIFRTLIPILRSSRCKFPEDLNLRFFITCEMFKGTFNMRDCIASNESFIWWTGNSAAGSGCDLLGMLSYHLHGGNHDPLRKPVVGFVGAPNKIRNSDFSFIATPRSVFVYFVVSLIQCSALICLFVG